MDCARARFLIYAHMDRELSPADAEALTRHLAECATCAVRSGSAHGLARLLHSRVERRPVPLRLRERLHVVPADGEPFRPSGARRRVPVFSAAAALLLTLLPLSSDTAPRPAIAAGMMAGGTALTRPLLVSRRLTGTFVCLKCESGDDPTSATHAEHANGFCAENGELWHLMPQDRGALEVDGGLGRTATVEGVAFPESGFLRVSRVGY